MAELRNRVKEMVMMRAGDVLNNERNWRKHGSAQREAYTALTDKIGFAGALLAYEMEDGALKLIDGHMRAAKHPNAIVPVLITDLSEDEAKLLLAEYDPLGAMAEADYEALESLLSELAGNDPPIEDQTSPPTPLLEERGEEITRGDVPDALWATDNDWGVPVLDMHMMADALDLPVALWGAGSGSRRRW